MTPAESALRRLLDLPDTLTFSWRIAAAPGGMPAVEVTIPLAAGLELCLLLYRTVPGQAFWLRVGEVSLGYCLDAAGGDPFADPDLRRFLLALAARFKLKQRHLGADQAHYLDLLLPPLAAQA